VRTRIKVCGITRPADAVAAVEAGADYVGIVLTPSPRRLTLEGARAVRAALPREAPLVGVFTDEPPETVTPIAASLELHAVQVAGWLGRPDDLACEVWHVLRGAELPDPATLPMVPLTTYLLDAHDPVQAGGTGRQADWSWAKRAVDGGLRLFVAGGLNPGNVASLLLDVRPFGVDASGGLESEVGKKSPERIRAFIERVREADSERPRRS